jgi:TolB-like protein/Tfp pilus assembly protein PilF
MQGLLQRLRERKLVQWALAYVAAAFALIQVLDVVAQRFAWPESLERILILVLAFGFFVTLVLAWYHGERGAQRVTGTELLILALLLAIGGGLLWRMTPAPQKASVTDAVKPVGKPTAPASTKSIAVLPFENLSEDKANGYFASGMQDEILTRLAGIRDLKVISRTSTEQYASHPPNLKVVAEQLGVATVLEGSVQKAANKVRINLQLIDAQSDSHLWAQNYDRDLADVFAVQSDVAEKVADALKAQLLPAESARLSGAPTANVQAHDLYLQARELFNQLQVSSAAEPEAVGRDAAKLYRRAIAADPDFALAYAWLSYLQSYLHWYNVDTSPTLVAEARDNARKALALQPDLPEAHLAMGYVHYWGSRDYAAALVEFSIARAALPNSAQTLAAIGYVQRRQGQVAQSIVELEKASRLDPRNSLILREIAASLTMLRRYDEADTMYARSLAVFPNDTEARGQRAIVQMMRGDTASASAILASVLADNDPQGTISLVRFRLQMLLRKPDAAIGVLAHAPDWLMSRFEHSVVPVTSLRAQALAMRGDAAAAHTQYLLAEGQLRALLDNPVTANDASSHLGIVYAGLGRMQEALAAARSAAVQISLSRDPMVGAFNLERLARTEAQVGETSSAIEHLRQLLDAPAGSVVAVPILRIDPAWDTIRNDPGFQALLKKYANAEPNAAAGTTHE